MLKHGRAGVPMEVMGLMLGEFVDDYTVRVIDVFAMPQSGTVSSKMSLHFGITSNSNPHTNQNQSKSYLGYHCDVRSVSVFADGCCV